MIRKVFLSIASCLTLAFALQAQSVITGTLKQQREDHLLPLPGCTVFAQSSENGPLVGEFTDDRGNFILQFPPDPRVTVGATCPGYRLVSINGRRGPLAAFDCSEPGACAEVELVHEPLAVLEGNVLDPNGLPVEDVRVELTQPDAPPRSRRYAVTSDDRGYFRFFHMPPGTYQLGLLGANNLREGVNWQGDLLPVELRPGDVQSGVQFRLRLDEGMAFSGRIAGLPPGTTEIQLMLQRRDAGPRDAISKRAVVDAEGRFRLTGVLPGRYDVAAWLPSAADGPRGGTAASIGSLDLNASTGEVVFVRQQPIRLAGTIQAEWPENFPGPAEGGPITLRFVREDGFSRIAVARPPDYRFEMDGLLSGRYQASATGLGAQVERMVREDEWEPFREIALTEGQTLELALRVRFEIGRLAVIVKTADAAPAAHFVVGIRRNGITRLFPADQYGRLDIDFFPAGDYQICAWPDISQEKADDPEIWLESNPAVRQFRHEEGVDMEITLTAAP